MQEIKFDREEPNIEAILQNLQIKDNRLAIPTSKTEQAQVEPPSNVTHIYVKQHDTKGLQPRYRGPFKVLSNPSRSTVEIKAGLTAKGEIRSELRSWSDCKPAFMREDTVEVQV